MQNSPVSSFCEHTILAQDADRLPTVHLFDLDIAAVSFDAAVDALVRNATKRDGRARIVVTPNVDHITRLSTKPEFRQRYGKADFIFADGMPVVWASRFLGRPLPERVTGADLFVALCKDAQASGKRVMLLGGMPGNEAALQQRFAQYYPGMHIDIVCPPMGFDPFGEDGQAFALRVQEQQPDVIFLCVGMPKQEEWALHYSSCLPGGIVLCVGAAMEFAIGLQQRAPLWMQRAGLEWCWRLANNPRRLWHRYFVDDRRFLSLCWKQWREQRSRDASAL